MALFVLCQYHFGQPQTDRFKTGLQTAIDCPQCVVIDQGVDD